MNLNDIRLTPQHLAGLYSSSLVELGTPSPGHPLPPPAAEPAPVAASPLAPLPGPPPFLGQHGKGILMVNNDPEARFIADGDLEVLTKIMGRAGIGLADIAIVNWAQLPAPDGPALLGALPSRQVLLFGLGPDVFGLPVLFPHYQVQQLSGRTYLCAPPLSVLANAEEAVKKNFWTSFKTWLG
ncbi:hypothetical protein [Flaviaesturariibacter amylovorans]|uniref:Uracil-DNA glycosylase-like domain-containing protein n=1 Tax=Flaviaesturariibacter amylovorans TaxID=1084520 RepID=A0ABP8GMC1_9BACT